MIKKTLKEFTPSLIFVGKFIGLYLVLNFLYGVLITSYESSPDPFTNQVSNQTALVLNALHWPVTIKDSPTRPTTQIIYEKRAVLSVYEGCNGINTAIIFCAFLFAFGPYRKELAWFLPLGILIIHLSNLLRIILLFFVARFSPQYMYFIHKYFFTASLYVVIFVLWFWWIKKFGLTRDPQ